MANKLYVGNLDYSVTGDQLRNLFSQAGSVVDATVISDRYSGRSKGFGFIEMGNDQDAKKAIEMFNGKDFQGRDMVVNEARPKRDDGFRPGGGAPGSDFAPSAQPPASQPQPMTSQPTDQPVEPVEEPEAPSEPAAEPEPEPEPEAEPVADKKKAKK